MILKIYSILIEGQILLKHNGIKTFKSDANFLLSKILNLKSTKNLLFKLNIKISLIKYARYVMLLNRRLKYEPIAHIIGVKNFWKKRYFINNNVLIPRIETEVIIQLILKKIFNHKFNILDLGVGSGCIILSLLLELKLSIGIGIDISKKALQVAKLNAKKLHLNKRVIFLESNWFNSLNYQNKFDIIFSNPPYITRNEWIFLENSVKNFEPHNALSDIKNDLFSCKIIASTAVQFLKKNGVLIMEISYNQKNEIKKIFKLNNYKFKFIKDFRNLVRFVIIN